MSDEEKHRYKLCLLLGFPSPDHLRNELTLRQESGWYRYLSQNPSGQDRADLLHALLIAHIRSSSGQKDVQVSDYIPKFDPVEQSNDPADAMLKLEMFCNRFKALHGEMIIDSRTGLPFETPPNS